MPAGLSPPRVLPRVLLVEDDPSIRLFVSIALEGFGIELVACENLTQAEQALRQGAAQLVLCDIHLPGECGLDFIERLASDPVLGNGARIVCFSGSIDDDAVLARLTRAGIWRVLPKPCPLSELEACVAQALEGIATACGAGAAPARSAARLDAMQRRAVEAHFEGDAALYQLYRASCLVQFPADLRQGEAALCAGDLPALQHLGHSLKTVLVILGQEALARTAQDLERLAAQGDADLALACWTALAEGLRGLLSAEPGPGYFAGDAPGATIS